MRSDSLSTQLRRLCQELAGRKAGGEISTLMLCDAVDAKDELSKAKVRKAVNHMAKRGELERIQNGLFRFVPTKAVVVERSGHSYQRMWRIIRTEKAGWSMSKVASASRAHITTVGEYCRWLEKQGFIAQCGKERNVRLFRSTQKAHEQRDTPYPPSNAKDKFAKERSAACRLVRLFMEPDPYKQKDKIVAECRVILENINKEQENAG